MNTMETIAKRKSIRSYQKGQISDELLNTILSAGCAAPVGMGMYDSLHLTIIQDSEILNQISKQISKVMNSTSDPLYGVPTLVLVSSKEDMPAPGLDLVNTGCIIENMMIAATDKKIGSVVIWATAIVVDADPDLREKLGIPEGFKPTASVALGYPEIIDDNQKELSITISTNRV